MGSALVRERVAGQGAADTFVVGLVEDYLWINLRGVRRRVLHVGRGRFQSVWGGNSLLEASTPWWRMLSVVAGWRSVMRQIGGLWSCKRTNVSDFVRREKATRRAHA